MSSFDIQELKRQASRLRAKHETFDDDRWKHPKGHVIHTENFHSRQAAVEFAKSVPNAVMSDQVLMSNPPQYQVNVYSGEPNPFYFVSGARYRAIMENDMDETAFRTKVLDQAERIVSQIFQGWGLQLVKKGGVLKTEFIWSDPKEDSK